jgi:hypothetical protein
VGREETNIIDILRLMGILKYSKLKRGKVNLR